MPMELETQLIALMAREVNILATVCSLKAAADILIRWLSISVETATILCASSACSLNITDIS